MIGPTRREDRSIGSSRRQWAKIGLRRTLRRRRLCGDGATLAELVAATGWLPHTTRAALTGLRKRGYAVGIDRADKTSSSERETLDASVVSLSGLSADQLRLQWRNHLGGIAPAHIAGWLLMRVLAYRIQATAFGDLDRAILRHLREIRDEAFELGDARPFATRGPTTREGVGLKSGALLVREWNSRLERVMVLDDGYAWNGGVYRSLSQVAKAITGTSWNGHSPALASSA